MKTVSPRWMTVTKPRMKTEWIYCAPDTKEAASVFTGTALRMRFPHRLRSLT